MESYGALLKEARLARGLDFETISRETTIARRYLEALEEEATDMFPGEAYLVGFLRNYAEYLGLDKEKLNNLYRAKTLQESPIPEGLIAKQRPRWIIPTVVIGIIVFVGATVF
ncbi:MAG: helix-turn-helix domain-containing protein, partial [Treponemataceae bacterium]|nr:helix-turn-helix domain-containing protein [Treponemataceae bacterium]